MKYRCDFVTNSSSSSFILEKSCGLTTIDEVYNFIRNAYIECHEKSQKVLEYCNQKNKEGKNYPTVSEYGSLSFSHMNIGFKSLSYEEKQKIWNKEKKY